MLGTILFLFLRGLAPVQLISLVAMALAYRMGLRKP
jgi:hypothetical protein